MENRKRRFSEDYLEYFYQKYRKYLNKHLKAKVKDSFEKDKKCDFYKYNPHNVLIESHEGKPNSLDFLMLRQIENTKYKCVLCRNNKKTKFDEASDMIECSILGDQCQLLAVDVEKFVKMISK